MLTYPASDAAGILADTGEDLQMLAKGTMKTLNEPTNRAITAAFAAVALSAAWKPHETFQYLGILGLELTVLYRLFQYESPIAAIRDWSEISAVAARKVAGVAMAGSKKAATAAQGAAVAAQSQVQSRLDSSTPQKPLGKPLSLDDVPPRPVVTSNASADMSRSGGGRQGNGKTNGRPAAAVGAAAASSTNGVTSKEGTAEPRLGAVGVSSTAKSEKAPLEADNKN
jgi:hypothetical protein